MSPEPLPSLVVPFVLKPHRNPVVGVRPQFFHQPIVPFNSPLAAQKVFDGFSTFEKLRTIDCASGNPRYTLVERFQDREYCRNLQPL